MHWKQYSDGLCVVGLGGGVSSSYPTRSASTPRVPGRLSTLQNSQRLFVSPTPRRKSSLHPKSVTSGGSFPDIIDIDIGVQGKAKVIHPNITSPREAIGTPVSSSNGPSLSRIKQGGSPTFESQETKSAMENSERTTEARFFQPAVHRSYPQHTLRTRSPATNSVTSLGDLSVTSVSLSSRSGAPQQPRKTSPETGSNFKDGESDFLSEIIGEYITPPTAGQGKTPQVSPRRAPSTYHSKLLRMRSILEDSGHQKDSITTQTIDLQKGNIQSFKKFLVLTQLPTASKTPTSKLNSDPTAMSESSASSSNDSQRERNMLMGLHQLSRLHASKRNSKQGENKSDTDCSTSRQEFPSLPCGSSIPEDRAATTLVDQWLVSCPMAGSTESTKRRIEFSVPSIEEEAEH